MKKILVFLMIVFSLNSCDQATLNQLGDILNEASQNGGLNATQISAGLKEALNIGIGKGADLLSKKDGYFKSSYKILLPPEARKITDRLKGIPGFTQVEDILLEKINRGAEDAAKKAKPIFVNAIKQMTFTDAKNILMGNNSAATTFLKTNTWNNLYSEFNPVIVQSLDKFQARKYWSDAVNAYNKIPFIEKANPDLDDYVTTSALDGLFGMVQKEETKIRTNVASRTTELLKRVFAAQDNR